MRRAADEHLYRTVEQRGRAVVLAEAQSVGVEPRGARVLPAHGGDGGERRDGEHGLALRLLALRLLRLHQPAQYVVHRHGLGKVGGPAAACRRAPLDAKAAELWVAARLPQAQQRLGQLVERAFRLSGRLGDGLGAARGLGAQQL